nr:zinc finger, CCHC-type [Tanacetum cinerariifolium]
VLSDLPYGCKPLGCKWIFKRKMKVDGTIDKFKARLVIQGFRQKEGIDYFDTYASVARITTIRLLLALLEYSRAIGCLLYVMTSTRPDIAYVVGRLSRFTSNPSRQHWKAITRVFKYLRDSSSKSGWVFLLRGGTTLWASKKQTRVTVFTMESEFVALAAAGKEEEWLRNLIHDIPNQ